MADFIRSEISDHFKMHDPDEEGQASWLSRAAAGLLMIGGYQAKYFCKDSPYTLHCSSVRRSNAQCRTDYATYALGLHPHRPLPPVHSTKAEASIHVLRQGACPRAVCLAAGVIAAGYGFACHMDKLPGGVQLWLQRWLSKEHERPATTSKLIAYHLELWFSDNRCCTSCTT